LFLAAIHDCEQYEEDGFLFFQCNIKTDMSTLETWGSTMMDLRNRLVDFQTQTDKIVDLLSLRTAVAANQSAMNVDLGNPSLITGSQTPLSSSLTDSTASQQPTTFQRYSTVDYHYEPIFLSETELQRCSTITIPKSDQLPTILLLPESIDGLE
jgi:hypothetical protein